MKPRRSWPMLIAAGIAVLSALSFLSEEMPCTGTGEALACLALKLS